MISVLMPITSPARVDERPARVARVDGGVGLDHLDGGAAHARARRSRPLKETTPTVTLLPPAGRTGCRPPSPTRRPRSGRSRRARSAVSGSLGSILSSADVGAGVLADDLRVVALAVREGHVDLVGAVDDVAVGEDVAVLVDHEARAEARLRRAPLRRARPRGRAEEALQRVVRRRGRGRGRGCGRFTTFEVLMLTTPGFAARAMSRKVSRPNARARAGARRGLGVGRRAAWRPAGPAS